MPRTPSTEAVPSKSASAAAHPRALLPATAQVDAPTYRDPEKPVEDRIADLLGRMTLLEKSRQLDLYMGAHFVDRMRNDTMMTIDAQFDEEAADRLFGDAGVGAIHDLYPPTSKVPNAIQRWLRRRSRLGIPALFAEEALHGVCAPGYTAFPQSIGLAATWNPDLVEKVAGVIGAELRACNVHMAFSPVLDVARDPRWGRVEETYGEDPYLVSQIGAAFIRGMQSDGPRSPYAALAMPKHFAGHGAPEGGRNSAPLHGGPREMLELMLPPFEAAVRECGVLGIMCAYHDVDGVPCASSQDLLTRILRDEWGFEGLVLSDLGAIRRLVEKHRTADGPADAIRQALKAGVDMQYYDFDHSVFEEAILSSVDDGSLSVDVVDRAVSRVLRLKFRLGLFDDSFVDELMAGQIVRQPKHLSINLEAARQSICLLKNDGGVLPLRKAGLRIAVIGPNAALVRAGDYAGGGDGKGISLVEGIRELVGSSSEVLVVDDGEVVHLPVEWLIAEDGSSRGLTSRVYAGLDCTGGAIVERINRTIDFNWIAALPAAGTPVDAFSVRWDGFVCVDKAVSGVFSVPSQEAMRLWVDGVLLLDTRDSTNSEAEVVLNAGQRYSLRVEFAKCGSGARVFVGWRANVDVHHRAVDIARSADVVIAAMGEPPGVSGEGMDRSNIELADDQMRLLRDVAEMGKPFVLVLMNGRPLTIPWAAAYVPAIVEAWYPAEFGGRAIAEVLFGDVNPSGRLPITFPKSIGQVPLTYDRKPSSDGGYVDGDSEPLFPVGHGLSYTEFSYSNLSLRHGKPGFSEFLVSVDVENVGRRDGDEVVQLYVRDVVASVTRPVRLLKGFERVSLRAGERRTVSFTLTSRHLSLVDRRLKRVVEPGEFEVFVGGSSTASMSARFEVG